MARSSRASALLCIDLVGDRLQATWLPGGKEPAHAGDDVPAWATPVMVGGELGWRVGQQAYARRFVDADDALMAVPSLLGHATAAHLDVSALPLPWVSDQLAEHESFELPMAHLLAQATRRALGEPDPAPQADAAEAAAGDDAPADHGEAAAQDEGSAAGAAQAADDLTRNDGDDAAAGGEEAVGAAHRSADASPDAPSNVLAQCDALLLIEGGAPPAAQAALLQAAEVAGLPAPSVMLRDEAVAWATWRTAQAEAHAFAVRQQMAADADAAAQRQLAAAAARQIVTPPADDMAPEEASDAAPADEVDDGTLGDAAEPNEAVSEAEGQSADAAANAPGDAPGAVAAQSDADASDAPPADASSSKPDVPKAWTQLHIGYGAIEACKVEVDEHGPRIVHRAREAGVGIAQLQGLAYGWARDAWRQAHGDTPLDAMAQRRLLDGALNALRRLAAAPTDGAAPLKETRMDLPALCLGQAGSDEEARDAEPLSLTATLSRKAAAELLHPLTDAVLGIFGQCRQEAAAAPAKGRKRPRHNAAPDEATPGLLCTGDVAAWPGLREALAERLGKGTPLEVPAPAAVAHAARTLQSGDASQAA